MTRDGAAAAESTLAKRDIHEEWAGNYRTPENEQFYAMAFEYIVKQLGAQPGDRVLDAGCGSCAKSRHLVGQGFQVLATDLSEEALQMARSAIQGTEYEDKIQLRQLNLTGIDMSDGTIRYAVCWGVLMHIPDIEQAIAELCRVLEPGGRIAISEANNRSVQSKVFRFVKKLLRRERARVVDAEAGTENWEETNEGQLLTRQADIAWTISEFQKHGCKLLCRHPGQFTELYWMMPTQFLARTVHLLNRFWFKRVRAAGPAFANILVFEKAKNL